jgi:hypothetical protein
MTTYIWDGAAYQKTFTDWPVLSVDIPELYPNIKVYEIASDSEFCEQENRQYFRDLFGKHNLSLNLPA